MKKSLSGSSTLFRFASGGLILFVIFLLFRKKKTLTKATAEEIYNLIRKEEGINFKAVRDGSDKKGNPLFTIGIGHQIQPNEQFLREETINEDEALELFEKDIQIVLNDLEKNVKVPLNKNQQLALISLRFRIGPSYFNSSTLLQELNKGNYQKASEEFKNWRLSDGKINGNLILRAERERVLFVTPVSSKGYNKPIVTEQKKTEKPTDLKSLTEENKKSLEELKKQLKEAEEKIKRGKENLQNLIKPKPKIFNS